MILGETHVNELLERLRALLNNAGLDKEPRRYWKLLHDAMRALNDLSETEQRDFTREENALWSRAVRKCEDLREAVKAHEANPIFRLGGMDDDQTPRTSGDPRILTRSQRLVDVVKGRSDVWNEAPLSFDRWLRGAVTGRWEGAAAELEATRAMSVGLDVQGGYAVPDLLSARVIDLARDKSVLMAAGARTVPMESGMLSLARVTGDPTAVWHAENNTESASDMTLGQITLRARTVVAIIKASIELLEDSEPTSLQGTIENALAQAIALEVDRTGLRGGGAGEPMGLANDDTIATTAINSGLAIDNVVTAVAAIRTRNHNPNAMIMSTRTQGGWEAKKDGSGRYFNDSTLPESVGRLQKLASSRIPITDSPGSGSKVFVGDFGKLLFGLRTQLTIEASREAGDASGGAFSKLQVWIRAHMRCDWIAEYSDAFQTLTGVTD